MERFLHHPVRLLLPIQTLIYWSLSGHPTENSVQPVMTCVTTGKGAAPLRVEALCQGLIVLPATSIECNT